MPLSNTPIGPPGRHDGDTAALGLSGRLTSKLCTRIEFGFRS
ncbi:MAG: hypothetical protein ACXVZ2_07930 [Gaiellaceae bacterium]